MKLNSKFTFILDQRYLHTFLLQIFMKEKTAFLIDPDENRLRTLKNKNGKVIGLKADWLDKKALHSSDDKDENANQLDKTNREVINDFLMEHFDIESVIFGVNNNGLAVPEHLFQQHRDTCNASIALNFFWIAIGYLEPPRFSRSFEQALFCRLMRAGENGEKPKILKNKIPGENKASLKKRLKTFINT